MIIKPKTPERYAFETHLNYISSVSTLGLDLSIEYTNSVSKKDISLYNTKQNLYELTSKSLKSEYEIIGVDPEYSYASTSWLPVKAYYMIFNLLLTAEYCLLPEERTFRRSHSKLLSSWNKRMLLGEIVFSDTCLGKVYGSEIFQSKIEGGTAYSRSTPKEELFKSALKMVAKHHYEDWRKAQSVKIGSKKGQELKAKFMEDYSVSIFDYFYYMRIRSNYRDFAFIDEVTPEETRNFFETYYSATMKLCGALSQLCKDLKKKRLN